MALQFSYPRAVVVGQTNPLLLMLGLILSPEILLNGVPSIRDPKQIFSGLIMFSLMIILVFVIAILVSMLAMAALEGF